MARRRGEERRGTRRELASLSVAERKERSGREERESGSFSPSPGPGAAASALARSAGWSKAGLEMDELKEGAGGPDVTELIFKRPDADGRTDGVVSSL